MHSKSQEKEQLSSSISDDLFTPKFTSLFNRVKNLTIQSEIKRIDPLTEDQFKQSVEPSSCPIVFRSSENMPSRDEILYLLRNFYGDLNILVRVGNYSEPNQYILNRQQKQTTLGSYLDYILNTGSDLGDLAYAGNIPLTENLARSINFAPRFYESEKYENPKMWLGGKGTITPLHKDGSDNFAVHIFGRKKWILFPVRDIPYLYMRRVLPDSDFAVSLIDLRTPDLERFPDFTKTIPIEIEVEAGETLYLPEGWGHYVENLEPTLMINYWLKECNKGKKII